MGCPVHIWAPLMAGMVPLARVARDHLHLTRAGRASKSAPARTLQRFAPVAPGAAADASKAARPEA